MSYLLDSRCQAASIDLSASTIGCGSLCHYCGRTLGQYRPVIIFDLEQPGVIGAAHPECGYFDFRYAQFTLDANLRLEVAQTSFLAHFYRHLVHLPGQGDPRFILRHCLAALLPDYPHSLQSLSGHLSLFVEDNRAEALFYPGDLETDFYLFLGEIKQAAENQPLAVLIDFNL